MKPRDAFNPSSPLYWLTLAAILGIIFIGVRFLVVPLTAAEAFGVRLANGSDGVAFACAKGIRDIFSGLVGLPFLLSGQRRAVAWIVLVATTIPLTDGFITMAFAGFRPAILAVHWGAAVYMMVIVFFLFRTSQAFAASSSFGVRG